MNLIFDNTLHKPDDIEGYIELQKYIASVKEKSIDDWIELLKWYTCNDLFYSLNFIMSSSMVKHTKTGKLFHFHPYFLDLCRTAEYQVNSGSGLDASGRGSGKSEVRTKVLPISLFLKYPDIAILIISAEKQLAVRHLRKIKNEIDSNALIQALFPHVVWQDGKEALKEGAPWGKEEGLCVKRDIVRTNLTVEISAFFGASPIGSRYDVILADDIESSKYVNSAEAATKLKTSFSEIVSLATPVVLPHPVILMSNTRFSRMGLVQEKLDQYLALDPKKVRAVPGEDRNQPGGGPLGGTAIYPYTLEMLWEKWNETPIKDEYALQIALDYTAASEYELVHDNLQWYKEDPYRFGKDKVVYICVDCSRGIEDPTFIWVWGLGEDKRYYWLDGSRKKMDPSKPEFYNEVYMMIKKWQDLGQRVAQCRVEQMGGNVWADLIRTEMERRGVWNVPIVASTNPGKKTGRFMSGKMDRIYTRWSPPLNRSEIVFPIPVNEQGRGIIFTDEKGKSGDLVSYFLEYELGSFPRCSHDDGLDSGALIWDEKLNTEFPLQWGSKPKPKMPMTSRLRTSWMSA